ncbi:MAG TPA: serine/threonine-protein kinase [Clostridiales bacterium]|nr:serine/threonine-protein kinase [Clostridiales bacterium]
MESNKNIEGNTKQNSFNELLPGERYKLVKILGSGGMSTVYLAENINLGTYWAIKKISKNSNTSVDILVEPNILKKLNHPALPRIIDIMEDNEYLYIVQDFIEGNPLDKELRKNGKFPLRNVVEWALQICDVLIYLHSFEPNPIIYRDMKPANIILTPWGEIKLVDFGIAREYKKGRSNDTVNIGTIGYAAPEQFGGGQSNITTDIYSFGVTLFQLITGKELQEFSLGIKLPGHYADGINLQMEQIICKCTRFNPEERYQSVEQLKKDIESVRNSFLKHKAEIADSQTESINTSKIMNIMNTMNTLNTANTTNTLNTANVAGETGNEAIDADTAPEIENMRSKAFWKRKKQSRIMHFKRMIITVWDNTEFACEMAYIAAKATDFEILLVDLDLLSPKADLFLNIKKYPEIILREGILNESGLNIVLDSAERGYLSRENIIGACIKRKDLKNLYILTGNYKLDNYEYYSNDSLTQFIDKACQIFDIIVLAVNKSIYDLFTTISLIKSDINIIPIHAVVDKFREFNNYIVFLGDKQQIPLEKNKFIAYEYDSRVHLPVSVIEEATQYNYLGSVKYCPRREKYRNLQIAYARKMDKKIEYDYISILEKLKVLPELKVLHEL